MEALQAKLAAENALPGHEVMVTAGANQAFVNIVLTLLDAGDRAVLFRPYYFNHLMALQVRLWPGCGPAGAQWRFQAENVKCQILA